MGVVLIVQEDAHPSGSGAVSACRCFAGAATLNQPTKRDEQQNYTRSYNEVLHPHYLLVDGFSDSSLVDGFSDYSLVDGFSVLFCSPEALLFIVRGRWLPR